jgi:hypothetical protein
VSKVSKKKAVKAKAKPARQPSLSAAPPKRIRVAALEAEYKSIEGMFQAHNLDATYMLFPVKSERVSQRDMLAVVLDSGYALSPYANFEDAREAAVALSELGGIKVVHVFRKRSKVVLNSTFDNGKQVSVVSFMRLMK